MFKSLKEKAIEKQVELDCRCAQAAKARQSGQGLTEYGIILAVIVVIAVIAVMVARPYLVAVWDNVVSQLGDMTNTLGITVPD